MNRRRFLSLSALGSAALHPASRLLSQTSATPINVTLGGPTGRRIAADFTGLSYESAQLSDPSFFAGGNRQLIDLVRSLGTHGVLRIGGNTSEYCFWKRDPEGKAAAPLEGPLPPDKGHVAPPRRVITEQAIHNLKEFIDAAGWSLIYGLNLGLGTPEMAAEEAAFVSRVMGDKLIAFQMANEPDLFYRNGLRPASYNTTAFNAEWRRFFTAVRARVPNAPFAGPDTAFNNDWLVPFAKEFRHEVKFISSHYYAEGPPTDPSMTIERLLRPDAKLEKEFAGLQQVTGETGLPFRIAETNSCYAAGKEGVSNTFASALWGADFMLRIAQAGGTGVNFHGGGNGWYTPIAGERTSGFQARPLYYGMRLIRELGHGDLLETRLSQPVEGLRVYAVKGQAGDVRIVAFNLNPSHPVLLDLDPGSSNARLRDVWTLTAPRLDATDHVTLGGESIQSDGTLKPMPHSDSKAGSLGRKPAMLAPASGALIEVRTR